MEDLVKKLLEISGQDNEVRPDSATFLSVLGRTYDEDLTSRIIAYALAKDNRFVEGLIREYMSVFDCPDYCPKDVAIYDVVVVCEKYMGVGRADIFIEIKKEDIVVATITIENKIYTWEHDHQTVTYYKWVNKHYPKSVNMFFYLRPDFNISTAECDKYVNITYTKLLDLIEADDYIIRDFRQHINDNLGAREMKLSESQIDIINNYDAFEKVLSEAKKKYAIKQNEIIEKIKAEWNCRYEKINFEEKSENIGVGSFRLYKDEWYLKDEYYFYVEIRFNKGKLDDISYQYTVKEYSDRKNKDKDILNYIEDTKRLVALNEGHYYVWEKENFSSSYSWTSDEWEEEFIKTSVEKLRDYVDATDGLFEEFMEYCKKQ
ncbi:MAG: PD-(D/E)XK nuclease family protein [Clostridia bacterium]|nr:PD-(D/E)XK nuclease family protein [Clostridia bacterium]